MANFYIVKITRDSLVPMITGEAIEVFDDGALGESNYFEWRKCAPQYGQKEETLIVHGCGGTDVPHSIPQEDLEFFRRFLRAWCNGPCRDGDIEVLTDSARLTQE